MDNILEVSLLNKVFTSGQRNHQHIIQDLSLSIRRGEFVSVMGPSGSGKSTLLYSISGMDKITSGSVMFQKQELSALKEKALAQIRLNSMGFIFQHIHLMRNLNLLDNIIIAGYHAKKMSRCEVEQRARHLMEMTGIASIADHNITQASGGQLQRVGICRALINVPDIIFGDEPTGALNSRSTSEIMDLLKTINEKGTTILLVTHDPKVAARTERVLFMLDGKIFGENQLGKFSGSSLEDREAKLTHWLMKLGL